MLAYLVLTNGNKWFFGFGLKSDLETRYKRIELPTYEWDLKQRGVGITYVTYL